MACPPLLNFFSFFCTHQNYNCFSSLDMVEYFHGKTIIILGKGAPILPLLSSLACPPPRPPKSETKVTTIDMKPYD